MMALLAIAAAVVLLLSLIPAGTLMAESDDEVLALIRLIGIDKSDLKNLSDEELNRLLDDKSNSEKLSDEEYRLLLNERNRRFQEENINILRRAQGYSSPKVYKNEKQEELWEKLSDINELYLKLWSKLVDVTSLHQRFQEGNENLMQEIYEIKKENKIKTYEEAVKVPRIRKNFLLIQRRTAYMEKVEQIGMRIIDGMEELVYLKRKTQDDIELVGVLGEEEIDGLVQNINQALEKYMPDAGELVIDVEGVELKSTEEIWKDIVKNK